MEERILEHWIWKSYPLIRQKKKRAIEKNCESIQSCLKKRKVVRIISPLSERSQKNIPTKHDNYKLISQNKLKETKKVTETMKEQQKLELEKLRNEKIGQKI